MTLPARGSTPTPGGQTGVGRSLIPLLGATAVDAIVTAAQVPEAGLIALGVGLAQALWNMRAERFAASAAEAYGGTTEQLGQRLLDDERFVDLFATGLLAARRTQSDAKRNAMARVLGRALQDDAEIDDDAALLTTLAALDAPHFRLLAELEAGTWREFGPTPQDGRPSERVPEPYRAALIANGLVSLGSTYDGADLIDSVSGFGHKLLAWLRDTPLPDE